MATPQRVPNFVHDKMLVSIETIFKFVFPAN